MKKRNIPASVLALCFILTGCSSTVAAASSASAAPSATAAAVETASPLAATETPSPVSVASTDMFTERDYDPSFDESSAFTIKLDGDSAQSDSGNVEVDGSTVTIKDEGTYIISGTLEHGMIIVDAEKTDKLQIVLNGVDINSADSAAIYVRQADKVFLTLATGTTNTLSNSGAFTAIDDNNIDGVIFSKDDLTFNGAGKLIVNSPAAHAVVSKDDLVITGGSYELTSASHALSGKQSVRISDGIFNLNSEKDAIHSENTDDTELGFVYISSGTFDINSVGDAISASAYLFIEGGVFNIVSGGGSASVSKSDSGDWKWGRDASIQESVVDSESAKALKAAGSLEINGGSFTIDSADDAIHSNGNLTINAGEFNISAGDDGIHADETLSITGGTINISSSYEGIEGQIIDISGGDIDLTASDDGLNAAGGNDASGYGGFGFSGNEKESYASSSSSGINISGGTLKIDAGGDGVDSNGYLTVSGGTTYVSGPTNNGNGALDYNTTASITGGIFAATGASGMAMNFGSASTQGSILVTLDSPDGGELILTDGSGKTLLTWSVEKAFNSVLISLPELEKGGTYTLSCGSATTEIIMDSLIYGSSSMGGMGGGMGGGRGGKGEMRGQGVPGDMPTGEERPEKPTGEGNGEMSPSM